MSEPTFPETFVAQRDEDVSGVSGEGVIAEGCRFSDGWVVTHWLDQPPMHEPKTDVWHHKGVAPFRKIHGHGGRTRIVWADEVEVARRKNLAALVEAFDVPPEVCGPEAEGAYLRERIEQALSDAASVTRTRYTNGRHLGVTSGPVEVQGALSALADAVVPIVASVMEQRNRAREAVGRASRLAEVWRAAHGSAGFLVRAAGVELRDELDQPSGVAATEVSANGNAEFVGASLPAVECSAQFTGHFPKKQCIRAAQHRGDHIDEHGFHWSDTVAVYPVIDGEPQYAHAVPDCSNPDHACRKCGNCVNEHPGDGDCPPGTGPEPTIDFGELTEALRVLDIDPSNEPPDVHGWLMTACRELEKATATIEGVRAVVADARKWSLPGSQLASFVFRTQEALGTVGANHARAARLGANDRLACPYCTGGPLLVRSELGAHVQGKHARVLAVLASGGNLDQQLADPETRCRLPHDMEP